jgi:hypothetical protein
LNVLALLNTDPNAVLLEYGPVESWDTSRVSDMSFGTSLPSAFDYNITGWDVTSVTTMSAMFEWHATFDNAGHALTLDTSRLEDMSYMFYRATGFAQSLQIETSNVHTMKGAFATASALNQPLLFDTERVTTMHALFADAAVFNRPLAFDTASVSDMRYMFACTACPNGFNQPLDAFDISSVAEMDDMFTASSLDDCNRRLVHDHFVSMDPCTPPCWSPGSSHVGDWSSFAC